MARSRSSRAMRDWQRMLEERPERGRKVRWDIQGLRAFAVTAVVLDHLLKWPKGGFVGVDVFFVISGFLITGLLVREQQRHGHISFVGFYRRRAKRILPAALLVLAVTVVVSRHEFNSVRAKGIETDGIWAALFGANWRFRTLGTNYFTASNAISPLQHFWSLSIEEQFYFVWPWLMLAIFATLLARRGFSFDTARTVVFGFITALTAASFLWAMHETSTNATGAYFSTFSRAWELGLGAMCAVAAPVFYRIPDALRPVLAWIGLAVMTVSVFTVRSDSGFPAPWAALPVVATGLVIVAGTHREKDWQIPLVAPLTNRFSNYVGDVSYSLYLWHFPIIIIGKQALGDSNTDLAILGAGMLAVAVFSYHLVEDPVRTSTLWEMSRRQREMLRVAYFPLVRTVTYRNFVLGFVACLAALTVAISLQPAKAPPFVELAQGPSTTGSNGQTVAVALPPEMVRLQKAFAEAIPATSWPRMNPSIDSIMDGPQAPPNVLPCGLAEGLSVDRCTFGDKAGDHTIVVVGDSISVTYAGVLSFALKPSSGWKVISLGVFGCPFTGQNFTDLKGQLNAKCPGLKQSAIDTINSLRPDLVLFSGVTGHGESAGTTEMTAGYLKQLGKISPKIKIVAVTPPPTHVAFSECYTPNSVPADCLRSRGNSRPADFGVFRTLAEHLKNVTALDDGDLFCRYDQCPSFAARVPMMSDRYHMTPAYQEYVAPAFLAYLVSEKVLPKALSPN